MAKNRLAERKGNYPEFAQGFPEFKSGSQFGEFGFMNQIGAGGGGEDLRLAASAPEYAFAPECTTAALKSLVKSIRLYNVDKTHQYIIRYIGVQTTRVQIYLRDLNTGVDVCAFSKIDTIDYATYPVTYKLFNQVDGKYYSFAVVELNRANIIPGLYGPYATFEAGGIDPRAIYSTDEQADYLTNQIYHEKITVGIGKDFTTLKAAVESLYFPGTTQCMRSCYHNQILIDLDEGTYQATNLKIPNHVMIRGKGIDVTTIVKETDQQDAILEAHLETKMFDLSIHSDTGDGGTWLGEYCIHSDNFNTDTLAAGVRRLMQYFKNIKLTGGTNQKVWLFGCGISSGETIKFVNCTGFHNNTTAQTNVNCFGFHTTAGSLVTARIIMDKVAANGAVGVGVQGVTTPMNYIEYRNSTFILQKSGSWEEITI